MSMAGAAGGGRDDPGAAAEAAGGDGAGRGGSRKPAWLKQAAPSPRQYRATAALLDELELHTVCEEARCPNKGECFGAGTATFLVLGDTCTRACRFCSVRSAAPAGAGVATAVRPRDGAAGPAGLCVVDEEEPARIAAAASRLGLRHVVVTSVTRDDLPDGGAGHFAGAVRAVREALPAASVEVLIPDLGGDEAALGAVLAARPDVAGHNLETVPRLYPLVRPGAQYARSLELLRRAAAWARGAAGDARPLVKTGLMVGLGEEAPEIDGVLADCAAAGVDLVTVGQYLQPRRDCLPVARYVHPDEFAAWEARGAELGLAVTAAPFVRSSYRAGEAAQGARERHAGETAP
jgi:lipoic acid synthetase